LFTFQIRDLGDDRFYWYKSRYYDATIGKFQSLDPVPPDPNSPQALNKYAYADNNPLK
jgi:RHS repeat-associated protein